MPWSKSGSTLNRSNLDSMHSVEFSNISMQLNNNNSIKHPAFWHFDPLKHSPMKPRNYWENYLGSLKLRLDGTSPTGHQLFFLLYIMYILPYFISSPLIYKSYWAHFVISNASLSVIRVDNEGERRLIRFATETLILFTYLVDYLKHSLT